LTEGFIGNDPAAYFAGSILYRQALINNLRGGLTNSGQRSNQQTESSQNAAWTLPNGHGPPLHTQVSPDNLPQGTKLRHYTG
jgi:hypothetical protein